MESISSHCDGSGSIHDYNRQVTVHDASFPAPHQEYEAPALVHQSSVDFAKLMEQSSHAIIDSYFKATSPPVLEHMNKEILKKISDTEMEKVQYCATTLGILVIIIVSICMYVVL